MNIGNSQTIPDPFPCPCCGMVQRGGFGVGNNDKLHDVARAIVVCAECCRIYVVEYGTPRKVTPAEDVEFLRDPVVRHAQAAVIAANLRRCRTITAAWPRAAIQGELQRRARSN